ncbi:hypothetical protein [Muricoccus radiodurans]|uniref:hypothetical protein n=1 Tax=Muricoccus radiodurans TaxID=2231721 RepID=UPI003CF83A32
MSGAALSPLRLALCGAWADDRLGPLLRRLTELGHQVTPCRTGAASPAIPYEGSEIPPVRALAVREPAGAGAALDAVILVAEGEADAGGDAAALLDAVPGLLVLRAAPSGRDAAILPEALAARAAGILLPGPALLGPAREVCPGPVAVLDPVQPPEDWAGALLPVLATALEARPLMEAARETGRDLARWGAAADDPAVARVAALWDALFAEGADGAPGS